MMAPRPSVTNIDAFKNALVDVLFTIPSHQLEDFGYQGMVQDAAIYALSCNIPWTDFTDPGITYQGTRVNRMAGQGEDQPLNANLAKAEEAVWKAEKERLFSQQNVKRAVINALNRCIPRTYRRVPGGNIGVKNYRITNDPRNIIACLRSNYGQPTPDEKRQLQGRFHQGWSHVAETLEDFFNHLEDYYITSIRAPPRLPSNK